MKRVLIITYYWPPSGGSGVQRWLMMSKYLPEHGWQPVIYTPEDGEYPIEDPSLEKDVSPEAEVIRRPIVEPYTFYKKFLGIRKEEKVKAGFIKEKGQKTSWKERLAMWVRGNLFIPDARCWWVKPSVRYLKQYLKEHPVDAIISTGPPHSMHLIAMKLKEALGLPWIADFRDPWTEIDYYDELRLTRCADRKHHRLEREVLTKANKVVTVSPEWARGLGRLGDRRVKVIYNGFDRADADIPNRATPSNKFTITYLGVLFKVRNPERLWEALGELTKEDEAFAEQLQINLIGQIDGSVTQSIAQHGIQQFVNQRPYIPHDQVATALHESTLLLLPLMPDTEPGTRGLIPAKLFEYMASGRPILCIGPEDGNTATILSETQAGTMIGFGDMEKMKQVVQDYYQRYKDNGLPDCGSASIERFSRKALAGEVAQLLDRINEMP